ncbi:MerR family transcriptional regulator [Hydrogenovibrio sp. 3SP14C1]|uniref:MerR family transcriptional regulator n=1 Tax=Hydrogenovibrio sp. 3SP14C1 TaxID=3038774 RepID=UPI0024171303|nr:MerR family transcriptional regulator [Hydrogenovibrio sp. 3SP14C1]MDG4811516.1 MerR family transcriptional regulator [Hydrogenovibrio sp. 3SP14C1]
MTNSHHATDALFPIREVAKLTGVNPITLRAWERRYGLIEPVRTDSGHRLYTQHNIDTLKEVVQLTQQGIPISQIKNLVNIARPEIIEPKPEKELAPQLRKLLENQNIFELNALLDSMLADYPSEAWRDILTHLTLELSDNKDTPSYRLWHSLLIPRLHSRLHLSTRQLSPPLKRVWLQSTVETSDIQGALAALYMVSKGFYPLTQPSGQVDFATILPQLQALHCMGVVIIDETDSFDNDGWQTWIEAHPSFELFLFLNQKPGDISQQLQVNYHPLNSALLTP